jgi:hypothetical protein
VGRITVCALFIFYRRRRRKGAAAADFPLNVGGGTVELPGKVPSSQFWLKDQASTLKEMAKISTKTTKTTG